jgi:type IV pilus assembly protein PilE
MTKRTNQIVRRRREQGFTLIEVMIAVGIIGILAAIAVPSYSEHVRQSRRAAVKGTLVEAAQWMERFRAENNAVYTDAALPAGLSTVPSSGSAFYTVALTSTAATYELTATPGGSMAGDVCGAFTLAHDGQRSAAGVSSGSTYDRCWNR